MKTTRRRPIALLAAFAVASAAFGQLPDAIREADQAGYYAAFKETVLAAGAEVLTIQQPVGSSKTAYLDAAYIFSTVAVVVTLEKKGTAATTTTLTPVALNNWASGTEPTPSVAAFSASNVGSGTTISKYSLTANTSVTVDLTGVVLGSRGATTRNLTLRTTAVTGTVYLLFKWRER